MRTDVFGLTPRQHDLFGTDEPVLDSPMTADEIRTELERTLAELRSAETMPWPAKRMLETETIFPDHAARLPAAEADALLAAYDTEMRRLGRRR